MRRGGRLAALGYLVLGALLAACQSPAGSGGDADESTGGSGESVATEESGEEVGSTGPETGETGPDFDPNVCGSWEVDVPAPGGDMPPEAACPDAEACPQFTNVTLEAGISYEQYIPVSGAYMQCIFTLLSGEALFPNADCEPQWFSGGAAADTGYLDALRQLVTDDSLDPEFRALCMGLPSEDDLAAVGLDIYDWLESISQVNALVVEDLSGNGETLVDYRDEVRGWLRADEPDTVIEVQPTACGCRATPATALGSLAGLAFLVGIRRRMSPFLRSGRR